MVSGPMPALTRSAALKADTPPQKEKREPKSGKAAARSAARRTVMGKRARPDM